MRLQCTLYLCISSRDLRANVNETRRLHEGMRGIRLSGRLLNRWIFCGLVNTQADKGGPLLDIDGIRDKSRKGIPVAPVGLTACNFSRHEAIKNFFRAHRRGQPFSPTELPCSQRSNFCFSASFLFPPPACPRPPQVNPETQLLSTRRGRGREKKDEH